MADPSAQADFHYRGDYDQDGVRTYSTFVTCNRMQKLQKGVEQHLHRPLNDDEMLVPIIMYMCVDVQDPHSFIILH